MAGIKKKIALLTTTRADYGILRPLIEKLHKARWCNLDLLVSGTHLSKEFGYTYNEILADGFKSNFLIEMMLSSDTPESICKSSAVALIGFAEYFKTHQPDLLIVLGDRFEILSAAQAALINNITIAHLHGGESTEGLIDEAIRHSVSKMSNIHFTSNKKYSDRLISMGESPSSVYDVGSLGVENLLKHRFSSKSALEKKLNFSFGAKNFLLTYHPLTLTKKSNIKPLQYAVEHIVQKKNAKIFISYPNADTFGQKIVEFLNSVKSIYPNQIYLTKSFGQRLYFDLIKHVDCIVGNSSSGIIEVPYCKSASVNIGDRQKGRVAPSSVFFATEKKLSIQSSIDKALAMNAQELNKAANECLYGNGKTSNSIIKIIKSNMGKPLPMKTFYEKH